MVYCSPLLRMVTVIIPGPMKPGSAIVLSPMMDKDTVPIPGFFPLHRRNMGDMTTKDTVAAKQDRHGYRRDGKTYNEPAEQAHCIKPSHSRRPAEAVS